MSAHEGSAPASLRAPSAHRRARLARFAQALALCAAAPSCVQALPAGLTPGAAPARVRFVPPSGAEAPVTVSVTPPGMGPFECTTPCSMLLPAGTYSAQLITRGRLADVSAIVPPGDSRANVRFRRSGLLLGGRILTATGSAIVTTGGALAGAGAGTPGLLTSVSALALLIPGIIMLAVAGSDGLAFEAATPDTFAQGRLRDERLRAFTRVEESLAPAVAYAGWRF